MATFPLLVLGFNGWLLWTVLPLLSVEPPPSRGQLFGLVTPLLLLLWGSRSRPRLASWLLLGGVPITLLALLLLIRPLTGERTLDFSLFLLLGSSLVAYLAGAGSWVVQRRSQLGAAVAPEPQPAQAWASADPTTIPGAHPDGRSCTAVRWAIVIAGLPLLLQAAAFRGELTRSLRSAFPDHLPEARVALVLMALLVWLTVLLPALHPGTPGDPPATGDCSGPAPRSRTVRRVLGLVLLGSAGALAYLALVCFGSLRPGVGLLAAGLALILGRLASRLG